LFAHPEPFLGKAMRRSAVEKAAKGFERRMDCDPEEVTRPSAEAASLRLPNSLQFREALSFRMGCKCTLPASHSLPHPLQGNPRHFLPEVSDEAANCGGQWGASAGSGAGEQKRRGPAAPVRAFRRPPKATTSDEHFWPKIKSGHSSFQVRPLRFKPGQHHLSKKNILRT